MKPVEDTPTFTDATDADLATRVRLFLTGNRRGFSDVSVWAQSGTVRLAGPVRSYFLRQMAITLAKKVVGVYHVVDELDVDPLEDFSPRSRGDTPVEAQPVDAYVEADCETEN